MRIGFPDISGLFCFRCEQSKPYFTMQRECHTQGGSMQDITHIEEFGPLQGGETLQETPEREEIFEVLSNSRRRCIVHYLKKCEGRRVELREIVDYVAAWEEGTSIDKLDSARRKSVYSSVRQTHLPKLQDCGLIEYDYQRGDVELTDGIREVQLYLEHVPGNDIPWSEFYLGLSAIGAALVAVTWLGIYPFGGLSGLTLAGIMVALFAISAAIQTYQATKNKLGTGKYDIEE
jgi:hypothetical protein